MKHAPISGDLKIVKEEKQKEGKNNKRFVPIVHFFSKHLFFLFVGQFLHRVLFVLKKPRKSQGYLFSNI